MMTKATSHKQFYSWLIWFLAAAFFFTEYAARVSPSIMANELMQAFSVHALALGSLSAFFYYSYIGMQIPVGTLIDKYGPHRLLTVMAALAAVGCFLFAASHNIWTADIARFLMGFGSAFAFVGALKIANVWFAAARFGLLAGMTQALGMLGASFGEGPMAVFVEHFGWRAELWLIGSVLLLLAILIGIFIRDNPVHITPEGTQVVVKHKVGLLHALRTVFKNPQSWINSAFAGLLYAPTAAFAELWGVSYLSQVYNMDTETAAGAVSMIFLGWVLGGPLAGWFSDRIGKRKPIMYFSISASFIIMSMVLYLPNLTDWMVYVLLFVYGMCNTAVVIAYAVAGENNPKPVAGTSMAFCNMASVLIGASFQPIIGWFLDLEWTGKMVKGAPVYTAHDFHHAMLALPICLFVGIIVALFVQETYCRPAIITDEFEQYKEVWTN